MPKNNMPKVLVGQPIIFRLTPADRESMERLIENSSDLKNMSDAMRVACRMLLSSRGMVSTGDTTS